MSFRFVLLYKKVSTDDKQHKTIEESLIDLTFPTNDQVQKIGLYHETISYADNHRNSLLQATTVLPTLYELQISGGEQVFF